MYLRFNSKDCRTRRNKDACFPPGNGPCSNTERGLDCSKHCCSTHEQLSGTLMGLGYCAVQFCVQMIVCDVDTFAEVLVEADFAGKLASLMKSCNSVEMLHNCLALMKMLIATNAGEYVHV